MTKGKTRPDQPASEDADIRGPGLDHVGDEDASQLPEDETSIRLPIEEGDFDAQPR